jgi:hypothetical protein
MTSGAFVQFAEAFVRSAAHRSPFTRWFVPIGFTAIAVLAIWQEPRWSLFNGLYTVFALAMWAVFALGRRYLPNGNP